MRVNEHITHVPVARRTVFYIEGYDPRGPAHYHGLYRDEAARQAKVNGLDISVGPRRRIDRISAAWSVSTQTTATEYVFLRYDDIMRARWAKRGPAVLRDILRYTWAYLRRGVYAAMFRYARPILIFMLLAPAAVLIAALLAALAGTAAGLLVHWAAGLAAAAVTFAGLVALQPWLEPQMAAFWLARISAFTADLADGIPAMDERTDAFAERIAKEAMAGKADEVLVVGHSVGSFIAVSACARALGRLGETPGQLSLLTLGHTIPMLSVQPGASDFRRELAQVAGDARVDWVDFSAPGDGLCYPLTDPLAASGLVQPDPTTPRPKLLSTRYVKLFTPETYATLKRDFYRMHFQYLMAAELPGDYDYFLISAGDMSLSRRYAHLGAVTTFRTSRA